MTDLTSKKGLVLLVGAGPGDEGLLTLKGKTWIERADVIVYDYLANINLTRFAKPQTEIIYAGKQAGQEVMKQEAINALLIEKAQEGKTVVRLKGGDPFIFGRGGEEAQAIKNAGIPFMVVPGISSPVGVSAYAGIPLTHRDCSSSISIITGSNEKGKEDLHIDWEKIASRSGTLVFLMGARKLPRIVEKLLEFGKSPETPIAIIQWGTTPKQKSWVGTLGTIVKIALKEKISPPALTIVGEVAALKSEIDWFETLPLFGKTIVITRAREQSESFTQLLMEKGAEPYSFPVIQTVPPEDWGPLDTALANLGKYDGLIFTSVNGVNFFLQRLKQKGKDIRELKGVRIFAIGPKTAQAVRDLGICVDVVPEKFVAESLLESLGKEDVKGKHYLLPRAQVAREILPHTLRDLGAEIDVAPAYQTILPVTLKDDLHKKLKDGNIDAITFTSSSTVQNFINILGDDLTPLLNKTTIACIGPVTAKTAESMGLKVDIIPEDYTIEALTQAIENHFKKL